MYKFQNPSIYYYKYRIYIIYKYVIGRYIYYDRITDALALKLVHAILKCLFV